MSVTATFEPAHVSSPPGAAAALTLRLRNDADGEEVVHLKAMGDLAESTVLQSETIYLEPGEDFDVPVIVDVSAALIAGMHRSGIEVSTKEGSAVTAEATIDVTETSAYTVSLAPTRSSSATAGKHKLSIENLGNVPITVDITAMAETEAASIELAAPAVSVDPGKTAKVELKVHPRERFWNGAAEEHPFAVHVIGNDNEKHEEEAIYEQGPRLRPWLLPAAVGAVSALAIGTLAWFALLKPSVESIADDRATAINLEDQERLDEKILELEEAAADARDLPLGTPADLRLNASASPGGSATESFTVAADRMLSITDIVFQNPDGANGRVALLRSGEVLLESELANFRDLDFHFVAPFRFNGSDTVEILLECTTPGPNSPDCVVGASIVGFVDSAG